MSPHTPPPEHGVEFGGADPAFPEQADLLRDLESTLRDLAEHFPGALGADDRPKRRLTEGVGALRAAEATVRRRLGTPAQQASYWADIARARTLQALGDRVGAASYVQKYFEPPGENTEG